MNRLRSFAAPPARQASDLAGKPGDLPLTAWCRRRADQVTAGALVSALVAFGLFVVPLLVR